MNLKTLREAHGKEAWIELARRAGTSEKYIYQCAEGHRSPSPRLARKLVAADRRLTLEALRPDIYGKAA